MWYKGTVVELRSAAPPRDAPLEDKQGYDPWESLAVQWDRGESGLLLCCSAAAADGGGGGPLLWQS